MKDQMEERHGIGRRIGKALIERIGSVVLILIVILIGVSIPGYLLPNWEWTGLRGTTDGGPKTLWHWLDLLIIPMVLAAGALWFRKAEANTAAFIEEQRAQQASLETYFDRMSELLLDKDEPLLASKVGSTCREMAFTYTVTILRRLDHRRRSQVFNFLRDARQLGVKTEREVKNVDGTKKMVFENDPVAIFAGRNMRGIDLTEAKLGGADLRKSDLREAVLVQADLSEANLVRVDLSKAKLCRANLREAKLDSADLRGAKLRGADLSGVYMPSADLSGADLGGMRITKSVSLIRSIPTAELRDAILRGADLRGAYVYSASLLRADLSGADLREADLSGADLSEANLHQADLREVSGLTCDKLKRAKNWEQAYRDEKLRCGAEIPKPPQAE